MTEKTSRDGLGRALLAGLLAGAVVLGLLVAAYEIGRDRGRDDAGRTAAPATTTATTTAPTETTPPASGAAAVAAGRELFTSSGCSGCHSLDGSRGVGPTLKGLAGSRVTLAGGQTVTADDAYLAESIRTPAARVVSGYSAGAMPTLGLDGRQIAAVVAFIRASR